MIARNNHLWLAGVSVIVLLAMLSLLVLVVPPNIVRSHLRATTTVVPVFPLPSPDPEADPVEVCRQECRDSYMGCLLRSMEIVMACYWTLDRLGFDPTESVDRCRALDETLGLGCNRYHSSCLSSCASAV